jgi:hypothetical protein
MGEGRPFLSSHQTFMALFTHFSRVRHLTRTNRGNLTSKISFIFIARHHIHMMVGGEEEGDGKEGKSMIAVATQIEASFQHSFGVSHSF